MNRIAFTALLIAGLAGAALSRPNLLDWRLDGRAGAVLSNQRLTLFNLTDKEDLKYGSRTWGINLVWDKAPDLNNVQIVNRGNPGRQIVYTELVAIRINGGGYLKYEKRSFGINLGWSSAPVYEWRIGGDGGNPGDPIKTGDSLGLFNTVAKDFVIYDSRRTGINLVWGKDLGTKGWSGLFTDIGRVLDKVSLRRMMDWFKSRSEEK